MKLYKTKKAAVAGIEEDENFFIEETFCPLIQKSCNPACVCVFRPKIVSTTKGWEVNGHVHCGNYMFKGKIKC